MGVPNAVANEEYPGEQKRDGFLFGGRCSPGNNSAGPKLSIILHTYSSYAYGLANLVQLRFNTTHHLFVRAEVVEGLLTAYR